MNCVALVPPQVIVNMQLDSELRDSKQHKYQRNATFADFPNVGLINALILLNAAEKEV